LANQGEVLAVAAAEDWSAAMHVRGSSKGGQYGSKTQNKTPGPAQISRKPRTAARSQQESTPSQYPLTRSFTFVDFTAIGVLGKYGSFDLINMGVNFIAQLLFPLFPFNAFPWRAEREQLTRFGFGP
jgi:hypothetical protein